MISKFKTFPVIAFLFLLSFADSSFAASSLVDAAGNVGAWAPKVAKLVGNISMLAGIALFIYGILKLAQVEQGKAELKSVFFQLVAASAMVSLKPAMVVFEQTIGSTSSMSSNILGGGWASAGAGGAAKCVMANGVMTFIKLIGLIAFARGLLVLKAHGENKEGSVGRAITHMVGGSAAMNIEWTAKMLASTIKNDTVASILCI